MLILYLFQGEKHILRVFSNRICCWKENINKYHEMISHSTSIIMKLSRKSANTGLALIITYAIYV